MVFNFKIVKVDSKYCDYLRKFDKRVYYNFGQKDLRPFVGVLFNIENLEYFAPLTSPKLKHQTMKNTIDFIKIDNGLLGAINFNNMIPVKNENYQVIDLNKKIKNNEEAKYIKLLKEQLNWLNANSIQIKSKSKNLYNLYKKDKLPEKIKSRCCDFILLEEKCLEYNKSKEKSKISLNV